MEHLLITILIGLALLFDFLNGFHDSANVVATMISSRAMTPTAALVIASVANFIGPFVFGVAVAKTIGQDVALPSSLTIAVVLAALASASIWNIITWAFGIPSSSSHALIGGIVGAVMVGSGWQALRLEGLGLVAIALFLSPILGYALGQVVMRLSMWAVRNATPKANLFFKYAQIPSAFTLALSHGTNDAQKTMGIITMGLVVLGYQESFIVPWWVILASATAIGIGTASGGWRIIHTLGGKFYRIRPIHSFASQLSSMVVILTASLFGGPVSTTHVVSSSILGVGAAQRRSQVRWGVMSDILVAWFLTVPASAGVAALMYYLIEYLLSL
ncbi:MAG: inorganic phosphate transporter [Chloroflexi bacterium]|nr:MAG: inorganic phosphate transporter [Chloroflexota bacterium]